MIGSISIGLLSNKEANNAWIYRLAFTLKSNNGSFSEKKKKKKQQ